MWFAIATPLVFATDCKALSTRYFSAYRISEVVTLNCLFCNDIKVNAAESRSCADKEFIDNNLSKTDSFKYLRTCI